MYKLFDFEGINEDHRENKQFIVKTESINIVCLLCMWSILLFFLFFYLPCMYRVTCAVPHTSLVIEGKISKQENMVFLFKGPSV